MPVNKLPLSNAVWMVFSKDVLCEFRNRYAISALIMFALVTLSSISMTIGITALSYELTAVLLWIIIFFCAMAGLSRAFVQEQESGTLFTLQIYSQSQAIILGKMLFNIVLLIGLTWFIIPLFIIFLDVDFKLWGMFFLVVIFGDVGIGAVSTLTAAMVARAQGQHSLFTVLTFPILLPQFLGVINATATILGGNIPNLSQLIVMAGYDGVIIIASYMLFDYLWYE